MSNRTLNEGMGAAKKLFLLVLAGFALVAFLFSMLGCGHPHPHPPTPPTLTFDLVGCVEPVVDNYCPGVPGEKFTLDGPGYHAGLVADGNGYLFVQGVPAGATPIKLVIEADGYDRYEETTPPSTWVSANAAGTHNTFLLKRSVHTRKGLVRYNGRGVADDEGALLGFGTSYFSLFYMEKHEPDRLDANLKTLVGLDYIRVLADVGWPGRSSEACASDYWDVVNRADARAAKYGLRLEVSIFANNGAICFDNYNVRAGFVSKWAEWANTHPGRVWAFEISNEHIGVGSFPNEVSLGQQLDGQVQELVSSNGWCDNTRQWAAPHYRRNPWPDYWRQPWGGVCQGILVANDEPMGIESSVNQDPDARHQAAAAAVTWLTNAWFTLHSGAGVYAAECPGAECPPIGITGHRYANLYDQPTFGPAVQGILAVRKLLPTNLPNWSPCNFNSRNACSVIDGIDANLPYNGRFYGVLSGSAFVGVCAGDVCALPLTAHRAMTVSIYDPKTAQLLRTATLSPGQPLALGGTIDAYIIVGQ